MYRHLFVHLLFYIQISVDSQTSSPKKMYLIEAKVIYKRQLCLLDSFMSLDTSDASQPPFSSMLCRAGGFGRILG